VTASMSPRQSPASPAVSARARHGNPLPVQATCTEDDDDRWPPNRYEHQPPEIDTLGLCETCGHRLDAVVVAEGFTTHGLCRAPRRRARHGQTGTPEYRSWRAMKSRCTNPRHPRYARYGGRGVRIAPPWLDCFECFARDVGPRPPGTTLDRIDVDGNYEPGNVRWASPAVQARNRAARKPTRPAVGSETANSGDTNLEGGTP
jgi:hypothetical protein